MTSMIHPTAIVASSASIGSNVRIGAYAVIDDAVEIGDDCVIETHAVVCPFVVMGPGNKVCPHAVIGGLPQDTGFDPGSRTNVHIGANNVFREGVTVNRATQAGSATRIGSDCYFMNNSHVGHDCLVGNRAVFASGVAVGGFSEIGDRAFLGGGAMIHQFCRVGALVMVSGTVGVLQDVIPYTMAGDSPARHYRLNVVGLKRAGITAERYKMLSAAFRRLRNRESLKGLGDSPELNHLRAWLAAPSKRGISSFLNAS
ncbi:MAG: acyl-[acyl-carrier-protein]--UDP-N-acetylglucosamine O-acyltransferase [Methylococcus sp.]|nr:MAG: acyl-[acyl-carrier-protein]--UDP-N-acetylglucosamine O-acyltransferase [Methylococcus sp.]